MMIEFLQGIALPESVAEPLLSLSASLLVKCSTKMEIQVTIRLISTVSIISLPEESIKVLSWPKHWHHGHLYCHAKTSAFCTFSLIFEEGFLKL